MLEKKYYTAPLEIKAIENKDGIGTFKGYGSIFGNVDSYGDVVMPGAFTQSLQKRKPILLWQHDTDCPIGVITNAYEDAKGLVIEGTIETESDDGKRYYNLLKMDALRGLSIGYNTTKYHVVEIDDKTTYYLDEVELWEVSLVTFPANELATVTDVKSLENINTVGDIEQLLKNHGFSKKAAKTIISKIKQCDAVNEQEPAIDSRRDVEEFEAKLNALLEEMESAEINKLLQTYVKD